MNEQSINILLIEDTETDAIIVQRYLRTCAIPISSIQWVKSFAEANNAIAQDSYDIIITDLGLPDSSGADTVTRLRTNYTNMPILALTSQNSQHANTLGLKVIRAGANDYIPKDELSTSVIARAVTYTIERFRMTEKIDDARRELHAANQLLETKNKRLEQLCEMSQQFVDNVSHEFRTPLTVIREFAAIIKDGIDGPVTETQESRLGSLINRTDDLANMVDDLLDTSRLESGLLKTCREEHNLKDLVRQVERTLRTRARAKKIQLIVDDRFPQLTVFCDEEKLRRVLINLAVNAIKFTPVEGQVRISAEIEDRNRAIITVSDNGAGIPADDLKRIFERFQQVESHRRMASSKGFGLGLSIARSLASLNLGGLQVASEYGKGSQFSVTVPLARAESIMNCYLDQRIAATDNSEEIRVVEIVPGKFGDQDQTEVVASIDDFLRNTVRTFDLVMQPDDLRWLVFTSSSEEGVRGFEERLAKEWTNLKRNHYGVALPNLVSRTIVTTDALTGRETLIQLAQAKTASKSDNSNSAKPKDTECLEEPKRVLIIDDELDVSSAIQSRLQKKGFDVAAAYDGSTGLEVVKQSEPDVILLDIRMPTMDGLTVLRHLKADPETESTPVVVLSASLRDKQAVLDSGAEFFIQKPFQSHAILDALDSVLDTQSQQTTEGK
jgi:signal transduction histidine kinase